MRFSALESNPDYQRRNEILAEISDLEGIQIDNDFD
jgi:hypothetical protein